MILNKLAGQNGRTVEVDIFKCEKDYVLRQSSVIYRNVRFIKIGQRKIIIIFSFDMNSAVVFSNPITIGLFSLVYCAVGTYGRDEGFGKSTVFFA